MTSRARAVDLAGVRTHAALDGGTWVLFGAKTFISSGINADLVIVVTRTDPVPAARHWAFSLLVVERVMPGFSRGRTWTRSGRNRRTLRSCSSTRRPCRGHVLGTWGAASTT